MLVFEGEGKLKEFVGTYSELQVIRKNAVKQRAAERVAAPVERVKRDKPVRLTYGEKLELEGLEKEIPALEQKRDAQLASLGEAGIGHEEMTARSLSLEQTVNRLEQLSDRWLTLSEKASET